MHRKNNFDFLRLIFASFVIITHSYPLTGIAEYDWLSQVTNGQFAFSDIGVKGFFIISGYLIFQSFERSSGVMDYYWKRILRIFPGLAVVLILTVILSPFVYENKSVPYFSNNSMWTYIPNNLFFYKLQFSIDGVFESNPYKSVINGSLWTIPFEFTMYVFLSFLFFFRNKKTVMRSLLIIAMVFLAFVNFFFLEQLKSQGFTLFRMINLGVYFASGSLLAFLKVADGKFLNKAAIFSFVALVLCLILNISSKVEFIALPIMVIWFGLKSTPWINSIGEKIGDLSYGIYIYAFPVQQTLVYFFHFNYLELMLPSLAISSIFAYFSWHLIESRALRLKKYKSVNLKLTAKEGIENAAAK